MPATKIYITLFVYIREGETETFRAYEDRVLLLLAKYHGELVYRIRPEPRHFVYPPAAPEYPDEVHLLTFPTLTDFGNYRHDPERLAYAPLFQKAVRKVLLLQSAPL